MQRFSRGNAAIAAVNPLQINWFSECVGAGEAKNPQRAFSLPGNRHDFRSAVGLRHLAGITGL
jgi:hypothetical protein